MREGFLQFFSANDLETNFDLMKGILSHNENLHISVMCTNIDNSHLKLLKNVKNIGLSGCDNITDEGLKYLKNAIIVDLEICYNITDEGRDFLRDHGVEVIN